MTVKVFAPAKINLTLHVTGQRGDGYHLLDSLVVFGKTSDVITVQGANELSLQVIGPQARDVPAGGSNLVMRAANLMAKGRGAAITLMKNLPVASGIGGGSADAAATLNALSEFWDEPLPDPQEILKLGADVPVCLHDTPVRMSGIGEILEPMPRMPKGSGMLLVNPRVGVSTSDVFRGLINRNNPPMPDMIPAFSDVQEMANWLKTQRNDLQATAIDLQPKIAGVLGTIEKTDCLFARMSGSGATCFGLFASEEKAQAARDAIDMMHPEWWTDSFGLIGPDPS